ncbi:MAG: hypothetical protein ACXWZS_14015 [Gemmatirosa sp.]
MRVALAARIYVAVSAVVVAFQLALAAGAPWGELTMGGAFRGRLPPAMRAAAVGSAVLVLAFGAVVAARADLALPRWRRASQRLIWVVVAYTLVGVVLHMVTPSPRERIVWLPVLLVLAGCALVVARSRTERTERVA